MWSSFFKYLGSFVSGAEGIRFLEDSVVASVTKVAGALQSGCKSAVALPMSRLVDLHHALVANRSLEWCCMGPFPCEGWTLVFLDV